MSKKGKHEKNKRPRKKQKPSTVPKLPPQRSLLKRFWQWIISSVKLSWKTMVAFAVVVGIAGFLLAIYPRVDVSVGSSLDYYDPFKTPFVITNNGYFSVYNFEYILFGHELKTKFLDMTDFSDRHQKSFTAPEIESGKSITVFLDEAIKGLRNVVTEADIYMRIEYNYLPFERKTEWYRFETKVTFDGRYLWYPRPLIDSIVTHYQKEIARRYPPNRNKK